jgi:aspartate/methionine/tyrosine aminotransferase
MKVGWVVTLGPWSAEALRRLEVIADTFLSVGAPPQWAMPRWLADRRGIERQIRDRVRENLACLRKSGLEHLPVEAGWSVVVRVPSGHGGAEEILQERGVIVHPGSFYGLTGQGRVVLSLIGVAAEFSVGVGRLAWQG